jgi:hypothetical protein
MRVASLGSGGVLVRSTPVLTFSPGVREQPESPPRAPSRANAKPVPLAPALRPGRSNLPIVPGIRRRPSLDVGGIVGPLARLAATSGGRTAGKLLAIFVAVAALGIFAGLNMRSLTEDAGGPAMAGAAQPSGRTSDATASERVQARGTLAPRKEAAPRR